MGPHPQSEPTLLPLHGWMVNLIAMQNHPHLLHCSAAYRMHVYIVDSIGDNRPAFGGTVPHFHQVSRVPRNETDVPHFLENGIIFFRCRLFYVFALKYYQLKRAAEDRKRWHGLEDNLAQDSVLPRFSKGQGAI